MKLIIAGSRHLYVTYDQLADFLTENLGCWSHVTEIVSGGARGIDASGEDFAKRYELKLTQFPAEWYKHGKSAGPKRNLQMAMYADALLLIWDGQSKGSANMKARMLGMNKPVIEVIKK